MTGIPGGHDAAVGNGCDVRQDPAGGPTVDGRMLEDVTGRLRAAGIAHHVERIRPGLLTVIARANLAYWEIDIGRDGEPVDIQVFEFQGPVEALSALAPLIQRHQTRFRSASHSQKES